MMADPKAESLVTSFAMKWLNLNSLDLVQPDPKIFQGFNATLRKDFLTEAQMFLGSILLENKNVMDLLTSDHTFVNNRLARHYGIDGTEHVGVQGGYPDRSEPLRPAGQGRGADADLLWRPHLSGAARRVGARQDHRHASYAASAKRRNQPGSRGWARLRKRFGPAWSCTATRRACKQCHGVIDPTGLALENFDAIGQYRTTDRQANNAKHRRQHGSAERCRDQRPGRAAQTTRQPARCFRRRAHREAHDVRRQPPTGVFRYAPGSQGGAQCQERRLHSDVPGIGDRQYGCVPQARSGGRLQGGSPTNPRQLHGRTQSKHPMFLVL